MQTKVWHQSDVTARYFWINSTHSPDHFWEAKCSTLKACKIVVFNSRRLKLWKHVFGKVNFNTKQKQISLHRHFKGTRGQLLPYNRIYLREVCDNESQTQSKTRCVRTSNLCRKIRRILQNSLKIRTKNGLKRPCHIFFFPLKMIPAQFAESFRKPTKVFPNTTLARMIALV